MNTRELADYFITHSSGFHADLDLPEIDGKHAKIIREAYRQIRNGAAYTETNFRNWKEQSDLDTPAQVTRRTIRTQGLVKFLVKYVYKRTFRRNDDKLILSGLLDDVDAIKLLGAEDLLVENPVHLTPGVSSFYEVSGTSVNFRWLRYIYLLKRILDRQLLEDGGIWVDVGSYYGGLQGLVRKYRPKSRLVLIDFNHQLCRSFIYLSELFPNAKHIMPDQLLDNKDFRDLPSGAILYVPVSAYRYVADQTVDLVTNFFSLGEMRREFFNVYMRSRLFAESKKVFLVNRVVSAPYFEKTYDTDLSVLDYVFPNRHVEYFDLFPIHHYLIVRRPLYGRESSRNFSSPYFEMLTRQRNP